MRRALQILAQPRYYPWVVLAAAVLVLLPRLGSYGFWEPREIAVADAASRWLEKQGEPEASPRSGVEEEPEEEAQPEQPRNKMVGSEASGQPGGSGEPGVAAEPGPTEPPPKQTRPQPARAHPAEPPYNERLVAFGIDRLGFNERGARLPLAILGLLAVLAAYLIGSRAAGPRAGLLAGLITLSFPLLVLESRQLTSDIAAVTGSALVVLGLVGLALPSRWTELTSARRIWLPGLRMAADVALVAAGGLLSIEAAGPLLGLLPPLAGVGLGGLAWFISAHLGRQAAPRDGDRVPLAPVLVSAAALVGSALALAWFLDGAFTLVEAADGERGLFGWTVEAARTPLAGLDGAWKGKGDVQTPFSAAFEQLGFGLFPWVALAPLAVLRLAMVWLGPAEEVGAAGPAVPLSGRRPPWAAPMLFTWMAVAWVIQTIVIRKVGPAHYPALVGVGVAIAIWLEDILSARESAASEAEPARGSMPMLALFAFLAIVIIAKDLTSAPEELASLTASGVKYPDGAHLHRWIPGLGIPFALALAMGLFLWRGPYRLRVFRGRDLIATVGRYGLHAAVVLGVLFAGFLAQAWLPGLAERMSSRDLLEVYRERRVEGDVLGMLGNLGSGPAYYAGGDYEKLDSRQDLIAFLQRKSRVFALTRASELCPLHKESSKRGFRYHVVDDANVQFLLLSNKLGAGEVDHNPIVSSILRTPPPSIPRKMSAVFEDQIELIGVQMPQRVGRGDTFQMTFYYKVLKPVSRPWKIFVHIDPNSSNRIGADHAPIRGRCSMTYFQPGDYIVDTFDVKAGDRTYPKGPYRVFTGFFVGSSGNFTNMKVVGGNPDPQNRIPLGTIEVR